MSSTARRPATLYLTFRSIDEPSLGNKWRNAFTAFWPAYKGSFLQGEASRPSYLASLRALRRHMPEMLSCYERMVELSGGSDLAARFLAQYCPRPFFAACSQAVWLEGEPALVRNYDYSPRLCDGLVMRTAWNGRPVIAMTDSMSGVLDGMNEDGLAISLAFGGRRAFGDGFAIALVQRYILEICSTVVEACEVLRRIPVHLAYNIALVDKQGDFATVMVAPDQEAVVTSERVSTNHQGGERWKRYDELMQTDLRHTYLQGALETEGGEIDSFVERFLEAPLFRQSYAKGYGTVFTSVYFPCRGEVRYCWRDASWRLGFDVYREASRHTSFIDPDGVPSKRHVARRPHSFRRAPHLINP